MKWIQPMCVCVHLRRVSNVGKTLLTNVHSANSNWDKPTKSEFLPLLVVFRVFFSLKNCQKVSKLSKMVKSSRIVGQNLELAFTFSDGVWSVHLASRDRDGVLGQCVRKRPVVTLALQRSKISYLSLYLPQYLSPYLPS